MLRRKKKKEVKLKILGSGREVGRSGILLEYGDTKLLLDYGVALGSEEPSFPLHVAPRELDGILLTHAHLDHSGAVPLLYVSETKPLYTTPLTLELSQILIMDFLKISKFYVPYEAIELKNMMHYSKFVKYGEKITVGDCEIEIIESGHIPGSCMFKVRVDDLTVLYTGDYNTTETCLLSGFDKNIARKVDILITEATYAAFDHPSREKVEKEFIGKINEVLEGGGNVLIPAFSVGRAQEIMCVLAKHDVEYPVYLDGMARVVADLLLYYKDLLRDPKLYEKAYNRVKIVTGWRMRKKALKKPSVIISPAGMLKGGASVFYMEKILDEPKHAVFFVSYLIEGTPGRKTIEEGVFATKKGLNKVKARIEWFDFSSHVSRKGLREVAKELPSHAHVVVVHSGEEGENFIKYCREELNLPVYFPENGSELIFHF
ncbi:MAG: MBL fold metallo-hydrolase [Thermoprotei archaeon]|nr:MAG: MBL fold metallo-hydrolase [Thermoprotei archaeon]